MSESENLRPSWNSVPILQLRSFILSNKNVSGFFREKKKKKSAT